MVYAILIAIFVALLVGVVIAASAKDRYAEMTEEEFRAEAERSSLLGAAVLGLHKFLQPKRVEYVLKKDKNFFSSLLGLLIATGRRWQPGGCRGGFAGRRQAARA